MYSTYKKLSDISLRQKSSFTDILENEADAVSNNSLCFLIMVCVRRTFILYSKDSMFYNNFWTIRNGKIIEYQTKRTVMIIIPNIKYYEINNENVDFVIGDGGNPSVVYCHLWVLFLKEINGFMLNVTDQYCISPANSKEGFSCHPGDLLRKCRLCHGSCKSRKRGTRPPTDS